MDTDCDLDKPLTQKMTVVTADAAYEPSKELMKAESLLCSSVFSRLTMDWQRRGWMIYSVTYLGRNLAFDDVHPDGSW